MKNEQKHKLRNSVKLRLKNKLKFSDYKAVYGKVFKLTYKNETLYFGRAES